LWAVGVGLAGGGTARAALAELAVLAELVVLAELAVSVLLAVRTPEDAEASGCGSGLLCSQRQRLGGTSSWQGED
jgi:hypothetical protein